MRRITSALFLDFDNIFSGLLALDRGAALALAATPGRLIAQLAVQALAADERRDLLVRRAYLNPTGAVQDPSPGNDNRRIPLNRFRPHLVRAGFEVIDCPALTARQKNAADIRIVIDVLAALDAPVRYDEVIIASSDADFTPLLLKLRAEDRRTTIITAGVLAPAYQAVADRYIDEQHLISLLVPAGDDVQDVEDVEDVNEPPAIDAAARILPVESGTVEEAEGRARKALAQVLAAAPEPVSVAAIGNALHQAAGSEHVRATKWFGHKTLTAFIQSGNATLRFGPHLVWDPARHTEPEPELDLEVRGELPAFIADLRTATDLPLIASASWNAAFDVLAEYAATHTFALNEATKWGRDTLGERGTVVGRAVLAYIIRGCLFVSVRLDAEPPPTAAALRIAFAESVTERARSAGLEPTEADLALLDRWFSGQG